jgi:hypothetical protein
MKNGPLKYWLKKIFYYPVMRVKRFIDYAPLIWHDEDYDHNFILYMLQYKIKRTKEHIADHNMLESTEEKVAQMQEAEDIIARLLKGLYLEKEADAFHQKYPRKPMKQDSKGNWYSQSTHDKPEGAKWRALAARMRTLEDADWKRLGYLITNCLRGWWD